MSLENEGKTVGDIIEWYKTNLNNGKIPQEDIKQQSIIFFGSAIENIDKKTIYKKLHELYKSHLSKRCQLTRHIKRSQGGQGKHFNNPPDNFQTDKSDRKNAFIKMCNKELNKNETYNQWLNMKIDIFLSDKNDKIIR